MNASPENHLVTSPLDGPEMSAKALLVRPLAPRDIEAICVLYLEQFPEGCYSPLVPNLLALIIGEDSEECSDGYLRRLQRHVLSRLIIDSPLSLFQYENIQCAMGTEVKKINALSVRSGNLPAERISGHRKQTKGNIR